MKSKQNCAALAGGMSTFTAIAIVFSIWAGYAFDLWMIPNGLLLGAMICGGGLLLTLGFKRSVTNKYCYSVSCAFVAMAALSLISIGDWSRLQPAFFAIVAVYGLLSGLAGSLTAKCLSK